MVFLHGDPDAVPRAEGSHGGNAEDRAGQEQACTQCRHILAA